MIDLESLFIAILDKYGDDYLDKMKAPKKCLLIEDRKEAFLFLVQKVKDLGEDRTYFTPYNKRTICMRFIPKNTKKLSGWYSMSMVDLNLSIEEVFKEETVVILDTKKEPDKVEEVKVARKPKLTVEIFKPSDVKNPMPPINKCEKSIEPEIDRLLGLTEDDE